MYGYIYLNINTITGKKYIGKHRSETFDENYYGSGILLGEDMKKYPLDVYDRLILCWCETLEELNAKEKEFIAQYDAVRSEEYFNLSAGGDGGSISAVEMDPVRRQQKSERISAALKGHSVSEETRRLLSIRKQQAWQDPDSDLRARRKEIDKNKWQDPVCIENHLNGIHAYWEANKEERYEELSMTAKTRWESEEYREKQHQTRTSTEYKKLMTEKLTGKLKGYRTMHRGNEETRVPPDKVTDFQNDGWILGRKPFTLKHRQSLSASDSSTASKISMIHCVELDRDFASITHASSELGISIYFIKKSLDHGVTVDGYTFIERS